MTTGSSTGQTASRTRPDPSRSGYDQPAYPQKEPKSQTGNESGKMVAGFLNPGCKHDWFKLDDHLQTLASEGKTIWRCRTCARVTNTYDWQAP